MADSANKTLRFDGKSENFAMWSHQFKVYANSKGYGDLISGTETLKELADISADAVSLRKKNAEGYALLCLCVKQTEEGKGAYDAIMCAITDKAPEGCLYTAFDTLTRKYVSATTSAKRTAENKLRNRVLEEGEDPSSWILSVVAMRMSLVRQYGAIEWAGAQGDKKLLSHFIHTSGKHYTSGVLGWDKKLEDPSDPLTINELTTDMASIYARGVEDGTIVPKSQRDSQSEIVLAAQTTQYQGGQRNQMQQQGVQFTRKCFRCNESGHIARNCPQNANQRNCLLYTSDAADDPTRITLLLTRLHTK